MALCLTLVRRIRVPRLFRLQRFRGFRLARIVLRARGTDGNVVPRDGAFVCLGRTYLPLGEILPNPDISAPGVRGWLSDARPSSPVRSGVPIESRHPAASLPG